MSKFDGVKVFSATMMQDRAELGDKVTKWLADNATTIVPVEFVTRQSSDSRFHCIAIVLFWRYKADTRADLRAAVKPMFGPGARKP